jgi:hypothetical protein
MDVLCFVAIPSNVCKERNDRCNIFLEPLSIDPRMIFLRLTCRIRRWLITTLDSGNTK